MRTVKGEPIDKSNNISLKVKRQALGVTAFIMSSGVLVLEILPPPSIKICISEAVFILNNND
jgi:hypothetical protein